MRFEILGPLRLIRRNREVAMTAGRERALLAMLLLNPNQTVPLERLADALWPAGEAQDARNQLHGCVSRLRKRLSDTGGAGQIIVTDPAGYRAPVDHRALDLLEFRALVADARTAGADERPTEARDRYRTALALWRGPALAGIDRDAVRQAATGLDEERTRVLEECIDVELALGSGPELVGELTDLVHQYPYRERLHAALMLALYRADRQADALTAYQRIRQTLVAELGQEPGPALRELHQRILAGDQALRVMVSGGPTGTDPAQPPASNCLPRTLDDFTGRDADLGWLLEVAAQAGPYAPLVLTVDGMAGVGKTSLAVHAAHLLAPRYPDGQLFIDLHGHSEHRPLDPLAALSTLLRQLGVPPARIPTELDERIALWRTELATRRVLVVLDNAADTAQVTPLLPAGAGCLVIATSRRRLVDLDGGRPRSVDTLKPEYAVALLERIAGNRIREQPAAAAEVAKRCGHLPLALRLAAARLAHRPGWQVRDLADRLAGPHDPLAELATGDRTVTGAFALSYGDLVPASQWMFRLLGLHPGEHVDARAAAALAGERLDDAQRLLDELVDRHLIEEPQTGCYQMHDLTKAYATELARTVDPPEDREHAVELLFDYQLHAAARAGDHLESPASRRTFAPGEPIRPELVQDHAVQGTEWLEAERLNLVASVRLAGTLGKDRYTWQLARAMWPFLFLRCYVDDLLDTHLRGLEAAERLANPDAIAAMRNYLASAYTRAGKYDLAMEHMQQVLAWRERTGDRAGQAVARKNLAVIYSESGRLDETTRQLERALVAAHRSEDPHVIASVIVNTGNAYLYAGRYERALVYSRRGLALAREVGDDRLRAIALGNVGALRARLGEPRPALRLLTAALAAKRRGNNRYGEAETLSELGVAYRALGDLDRAAGYHRDALELMGDAGDRQGECAVLNEFGRTLLARGDTTTALESHQRALASATKIQHRYGQARALDGMAACLRETDPESARRHWLRALRLYQDLDLPERHDVERHLAALTRGHAAQDREGKGGAAS